MSNKIKYDVALSFAGEDRSYVDEVANSLKKQNIKVFYDRFEQTKLWGKNLYTYLSEIYKDKSRYTVMFISKHYAQKSWTNHERESAQARAFEENEEYILPARFDDTEIPGVLKTVGYISLSGLKPSEFAAIICEKIGIQSNIQIKENKNSPEKNIILNEPENRLSKPKKVKLSEIETLGKFAYDSDGLDKNRPNANEWVKKNVEEINQHYDIEEYIVEMKTLIKYAYDSDGLDKNKPNAIQWALSNYQNLKNDVDINSYVSQMKGLIKFAYDSDGLDKNKPNAIQWALSNYEKISLEYNTEEYIAKMNKLIMYAYSSSGLDKNKPNAIQWALNNIDSYEI
jgi:hypothetical protein